MKTLKILASSTLLLTTFTSFATECSVSTDNYNVNADDRAFYVGAEAGFAVPVISKFNHKRSGTNITLRKSELYSGKVGYTFYPQMSIEFSATHHPKYKLDYVLPANRFTPNRINGSTKAKTNSYMLNLVYDFNTYSNITPFVMIGAGITQVKVLPTSSSINGRPFFKVNKTSKNCQSWLAGVGLSYNVNSNLSIDLAAKGLIANQVKIKYERLDPVTRKFVAGSPIKTPIAVGEFGIGFTYKIPLAK